MPERDLLRPSLDGPALDPPPFASYMPSEVYTSEAVFERDMTETLPRSWVFVGDIGDVSEPGDYLTESVGYEPVIVLRGDDGVLRAFSNVCPHRASVVTAGAGNCGARLTCPYHGWTFRTDGSLAGAPLRDDFVEPLDMAQLGLRPLRLAVWERFIFINVSGDAPPLEDWLENAQLLLGNHELANVPRILRIEDTVEANWKVCYDNGIDTYHVQTVHGGSLCTIPTVDFDIRAGHTTASSVSSWADMPMSFVKDSLVGRARTGPVIFNVFPSFIVSAQPSGSAAIYWWRPISLTRTVAGTASYSIHADDPRLDEAMVRQVQNEDIGICEQVQVGLRSRFYQPGPRHNREIRIHGFQRWYMEMLARSAD